jgi:Haem-containing dehydratase
MQEFFASADAPDNLESAAFIDRAGCRNILSSADWTNPASYQRWKDKSGFESWWNDPARLHERPGHYREILTVPPSRFETSSVTIAKSEWRRQAVVQSWA